MTAVAAAKFLHCTPAFSLSLRGLLCAIPVASLPCVRPNSDEKGERYSSGRVSSVLSE